MPNDRAVQWRCALRTLTWYTRSMKLTSTEFRKNLFQIVDRALEGEFVEVSHKGRVVRLVPEDKTSKLSRLVKRNSYNGTAEDLERAQRELDDEMRSAWDNKWAHKL